MSKENIKNLSERIEKTRRDIFLIGSEKDSITLEIKKLKIKILRLEADRSEKNIDARILQESLNNMRGRYNDLLDSGVES